MNPIRFKVELLQEAQDFIDKVDAKTRAKVLYNIKKSQQVADVELFKKLNEDIWEFRTRYNRQTIRVLAFWNKEKDTIILCTHGFIKKTNKTPKREILKAEGIRKDYLKL